MQLKENERIDNLEINNYKIIQKNDGFCFGIDSVLLSDFAKEIKKNSKVVDLGTGTGILSILLCAKTNLSKIIGVEIQEEIAEMANRSVELNNLQDKIKIINSDIKNLQNYLPNNQYDAVIMNPPYMELNTGKININEKKLISRHEVTASLEDFIITAKNLLKDKSSVYIVHRPNRLIDLCYLLRKHKLEPKKIKFVYPKENSDSNLILIKAVKNGGTFLKICNPLYVYKNNGEYTDEILKIYNK